MFSVFLMSALARTRVVHNSRLSFSIADPGPEEIFVWWIMTPMGSSFRKGEFVDDNLDNTSKTLDEFIKNGRE